MLIDIVIASNGRDSVRVDARETCEIERSERLNPSMHYLDVRYRCQHIIIFSNVTYNRSDLVHTAFRQCNYLAALAWQRFNDVKSRTVIVASGVGRRWLLRDGNNRIDTPVYL